MIEINTGNDIKSSCPNFLGAAIYAHIENSIHNIELWNEIIFFCEKLNDSETIEDIKHNKAISATRAAYKTLGKDPNRYRPSSESLRRRILRGLPLYQVNTVVDLINLISMQSGYTISGLDADKINGDKLILGVGKTNEPYEGIGKGLLNIEGLPVYRDKLGGVGTPTSDNERTKLDEKSKHLLAIINAFDGDSAFFKETIDWMECLLKKYAGAKDITTYYF